MVNNRLAIIDKETGELVEEHLILIGRKPYTIDRGYVKIFIAFLYDLVENERIAGKSIRLLMYMLSKLDYHSYEITIIPQEAIEHLGVTPKTFYEWVNILINEGIIEKINRYKYKLRPYTAIKGETSKARKRELTRVSEGEDKDNPLYD
ncbi:MAG: replication/maintenance protein RepL [Nanopusillaceae archaeon]